MKFTKGQTVATTWERAVLKGKEIRCGTVVGFSPTHPDSVWIRWDDWQEKSRVLIPVDYLFDASHLV